MRNRGCRLTLSLLQQRTTSARLRPARGNACWLFLFFPGAFVWSVETLRATKGTRNNVDAVSRQHMARAVAPVSSSPSSSKRSQRAHHSTRTSAHAQAPTGRPGEHNTPALNWRPSAPPRRAKTRPVGPGQREPRCASRGMWRRSGHMINQATKQQTQRRGH